ncbi:hypothetical protein [Paraburkholderia sp. GAS334]|uniref:hypothetical protein n=1 Tax=Paraburkholderia sp. GAS334 TaxID=3035131 RepID=UPI003D24BE50
MSDEHAPWQIVEYEGFEIHAAPVPKDAQESEPRRQAGPYTYIGYVCHPGADPAIPGHSVPFHADGEETFATCDDALYEAFHVGRSIVDGTHPDLTVLPLVTGGV